MIKLIKKHQKKLMAIFSVGLMISFAAVGRLSNQERTDAVEGNIGKQPLLSSQIRQARSQWALVKAYAVAGAYDSANKMHRVPLTFSLAGNPVNEIAGERIGAQIDDPNHEAMYALLLREAVTMGIDVSTDEVNSLFVNNVGPNQSDGNPDFEGRMKVALHNFLMVAGAGQRAASAVKVSAPLTDQTIAAVGQEMSLNIVEFPRSKFVQALPSTQPLSEQEINAQFEKFKDVDPTTTDDHVGYKQPVEASLQFIGVRRDDVEKALAGTDIPLVDRYRYYTEHPDEFAPKAPTTADAFDTTLALSPGAGVKAPPKPFEDPTVQKDVLQRVRDARIDSLQATIISDLNSQMGIDYLAYKNATAPEVAAAGGHPTSMPAEAEAKAPRTTVGEPYGTFAYLQKLADRIQSKYKVLPVVGNIARPQSAAQLEANPVLKEADRASLPELQANINISTYATLFADALLDEASRKEARDQGVKPLVIEAPSPIMEDKSRPVGTAAQYIFRLTQIVPARAANRYDPGVAEAVEHDVLMNHALAKAHDAAQAFGETAIKGKMPLERAAGAAGLKIINTGYFSKVSRNGIEDYPMASRIDTARLIDAAYEKLRGAGPASHPIGWVDLPEEGKVVVFEIAALRPNGWSNATLLPVESDIEHRLTSMERAQFLTAWYSYDNVLARTKYVVAPHSATPEQPQNQLPQQAPISPF